MISLLPAISSKLRRQIAKIGPGPKKFQKLSAWFRVLNKRYVYAVLLDLLLIVLVAGIFAKPAQRMIQPLITPLSPLEQGKSGYEVFGFAPFWTFDKLSNIDFNVLTTISYFGVEINPDGSLDREGKGYQTFKSTQATNLFKQAHAHGTRVVLTLTQMDNDNIRGLLDDPDAQANAINQAVQEVTNRGIDGLNVDMEYSGNPGPEYRAKFTNFVASLTYQMHSKVPQSKVTVSVYASAVKEPKIYDIGGLANASDGIFMMAYDFAVAGSDNAIPTAPLYGYKEGKYWYDVATAVSDFLAYMPANKLILGVPYYGYNYLVYNPQVKAQTRPYWSWRGKPAAQTYSLAQDNIKPNMDGVDAYKTGWDNVGKVGWIAYHVSDTDTWRMLFLDDTKSLSMKYDFAKDKNLAGVGLWALGFDDGKKELWDLLSAKFGTKLADASVLAKEITGSEQ